MNKSNSIGIIGGADGPTAIFVTGDPTAAILTIVGIAAAVVLLIVGIVLWIRHRK